MRIIVISDCHGDINVIQDIVNKERNANIYLCLGDSMLPSSHLGPFVSVRGNCDYYYDDYPDERIIETPAGKIYAEHGHLRGYVDTEFLKEKGAKVYLYGHTHVHRLEEIDGYYFVNPGSTSRPRDDTNGSYLIIDATKDNGFKFTFKYL